MVIIEELEISNCFSIKKLLLCFTNKSFVTIFNCPNSYGLKSKLVMALQSVLMKTSKISPEGSPGCAPIKCYVRIKFIIPSKAKNEICVDAMRNAQTPSYIYYYFDGQQYIDHIRVFHERCQIDVSALFPLLNEVLSNENKNLMHCWMANQGPLRAERESSFELFANYLETNKHHSKQPNIEMLTETIIILDQETEQLKKRTFVDVANTTGRIFNYITFEKYIVQFYVPLAGKNTSLDELTWDHMDLHKVETFVQNSNGTDPLLWNKTESGLKYLLKIAQLIALAKHLGQKCIMLEDTTLLENYQNEEMLKEAIIESNGINEESNWENKNFLKQIVNVCNEMEIMIFMNYHGGLPLPPKGSNIIRCGDSFETNGRSIFVSADMKSMNLTEFVSLLSFATA